MWITLLLRVLKDHYALALKVAAYAALVVVAVVIVVCVVKSCNLAVQDATKDVPFIGKIVQRIEHKIPSVIGGTGGGILPVICPPSQDAPILSKHFRFDPHLDLGITVGLRLKSPAASNLYPSPNLGFSFFSYGKSKRENSWRFVRIGVGGLPSQGATITLSPVMFNVGAHMKSSILANTYVHPFVGINLPSKAPVVGIGISLSF